MTKNPLANALLAASYIALVASLFHFGPLLFNTPKDTVLAPIAMLSLFTLSAAVMGFIFFYRPVVMYLAGEQQAAVRLFVGTLIAFAVLTAIAFAALSAQALSSQPLPQLQL